MYLGIDLPCGLAPSLDLVGGGALEVVCAKQAVTEWFQPQPERRAALMARYARFKALYPLLKDSFRA